MYGERKGLDAVMIDVLEVVIRELDEVYLHDLREQRRKEQDQNSRDERRKARRERG